MSFGGVCQFTPQVFFASDALRSYHDDDAFEELNGFMMTDATPGLRNVNPIRPRKKMQTPVHFCR